MYYIGIDPGMSGAIAVIDSMGCLLETAKNAQTESDLYLFLQSWRHEQRKAIIEKVHSMPGQGVSSSFKFGTSYGFLRGILIATETPFDEVSPQRWQGYMQCKTGGDKNVSKAKAQQLFPTHKITHAIADAALLAEYLRRIEIGIK